MKITPEMVQNGEVTCPACNCEPEYTERTWQTKDGKRSRLIGYRCSCRAVVENGLLVGMAG